MKDIGLLFYGVFNEVLKEIQKAQQNNEGLVCYLQPYTSDVIKLLRDESPSLNNPIKLYLTTSDNLNNIVYECHVVGWEDKQTLSSDRIEKLNTHITLHQPGEKEIYPKTKNGKPCKNLIHIKKLIKREIPIDINNLIKVSDNKSCKHKTRAGGHAIVYVNEFSDVVPIDSTSDDIAKLIDSDITKTEKVTQIAARVGQGKFRQNVIDEWGIGERCALTGIDIKEMLIASHIKPWSECEKAIERLDGANGILLCAHIDKLFDQHLITFEKCESGYRLVVSSKLDESILKKIGIETGSVISSHNFSMDCQLKFESYLLVHNDKFLEKG